MACAKETISELTQEYTPLDKLQLDVCSKNGVPTKVSAIHIGFMEKRYFVNFRVPPLNSNQDTLSPDEEEWLEYMMFLEADFRWMLKLPHHRFWSQIVYDENLHRCLESYLSQAPREYDLSNLNLREELLAALRKIHKLVFLVFLRMSTYKESKQHHITPSKFGEIIYDNFIFDVPKLMDLCALYGLKNSAVLHRMMQNIFSVQPKYIDDLNESSRMIFTAFNSAEEKLIDISNKKSYSTKVEEAETELMQYIDVMNYITDISVTLYTFLENYPHGRQIFHQNGASLRLPTFYEQVFSILEKEMSRRSKSLENNNTFLDMKRKIVLSKSFLVRVFRNILDYAYIQNILNAKGSRTDEKVSIDLLTESFLEIMQEIISYKSFHCDYNILYPFDKDLEFFNEIGINLDSDKVSFILDSLLNDEETPSQTYTSSICNGARPKTQIISTEYTQKPVKNLQGLANMLKEKPPEDEPENEYPDSRVPSHEELKSLIQSVIDILQDYGEGFIQKCLEHYDYDSEKVINALLSDSLPDHLNHLDKNLKQVDWNSTNHETYSVLSERKNVFDNDEFDVFSRNDINMDNVHFGKKNRVEDSYDSLKNDQDSEFLKELTLNYEYEEDENLINIYEDEYDDTYDSAMVGLKEPEDDPDDEDDEPKTQNDLRDKPQDFCINPEILREKAEQRRQAYQSRHTNSRGGGPKRPGDDRQQKDRRKAQVGNHNRRKQADFKQSRGMVSLR